MEKTKKNKVEFLEGDHLKIWYSTSTYNGDVTVSFKQGQVLIKKGDLELAEQWGVKKKCEYKWKKVEKKSKK